MAKRDRKYTLDSNVFIRSFRDKSENDTIQRFHRVFGPFEYLSSVVAQELRAGVMNVRARRSLERHVLDPFRRRGRVFTPSAAGWEQAGDILAALRNTDGVDLKRIRRSFAMDILLAVSCREAGVVLVTENSGDFERIQKHIRFEFIEPWPDGLSDRMR
jgi:predicted nucleic acid-binding protein